MMDFGLVVQELMFLLKTERDNLEKNERYLQEHKAKAKESSDRVLEGQSRILQLEAAVKLLDSSEGVQ